MQVLRNTNAYLIRAALAVVGVLIGSLIFVTTSVAQPASAAPVESEHTGGFLSATTASLSAVSLTEPEGYTPRLDANGFTMGYLCDRWDICGTVINKGKKRLRIACGWSRREGPKDLRWLAPGKKSTPICKDADGVVVDKDHNLYKPGFRGIWTLYVIGEGHDKIRDITTILVKRKRK